MNTKWIMTLSAVLLGLSGIGLTFLPNEILNLLNLQTDLSLQLILQILGALYFGFAMLNWMSKSGRIGGIYNRPIAVANFSHFMIAGLALIKAVFPTSGLPKILWIVAAGYLIFAILFGMLLFRHPGNE